MDVIEVVIEVVIEAVVEDVVAIVAVISCASLSYLVEESGVNFQNVTSTSN